ncbi:MAG: DNA gyrase inhibitor YacG [Planctomycetes bacterium]|nr:DNA gyrase inhibitor YacG [Planctomycetota bacterium]
MTSRPTNVSDVDNHGCKVVTSLRCPTCENRFDTEKTTAMPFCSERCRLIDLGKWLNEEQSIPHVPSLDEFEESSLDELP